IYQPSRSQKGQGQPHKYSEIMHDKISANNYEYYKNRPLIDESGDQFLSQSGKEDWGSTVWMERAGKFRRTVITVRLITLTPCLCMQESCVTLDFQETIKGSI
ncbi:MAG: hypothetical protein KJO60_11980, partial [Desulfofustis sp.]|nr:hypothetical protein [Desulfofustis sp.]